MNPLHTVGHSTHPVRVFVDLLKSHSVNVVCDVRSVPYSRYNVDFSREALRAHLKIHGIKYIFFGDEFGARPVDRGCYVGGQARYERIAARPAFQVGVQRILRGLEGYRPALMCAEKDPVECHRAILVCRHLQRYEIDIRHILGDGSIETQQALGVRLTGILGLEPLPMFAQGEAWVGAIDKAFALQGLRIAYTEKSAEQTRMRLQVTK